MIGWLDGLLGKYQVYMVGGLVLFFVGFVWEGICGEFGWVGFLVVCILYKINSNPRKFIFLWEEVAPLPFLTYFFLGGS